MESVYRSLIAILLMLAPGVAAEAQNAAEFGESTEQAAEPNTSGDASGSADEGTADDEIPEDEAAAEPSDDADPEAQFLAGAMGSGMLEESMPQLRRVALMILGGMILLYFGLAFYRRLGTGKVFGATPKRRIRVADTVSLGGKRYLCAVEAMGQTLLVGVSGDRIQLLTELHGEHDGSAFGETFERASDGRPSRADSTDSSTGSSTGGAS